MEIGYKSYAIKELTSGGFGLPYAKRTQFRVVEGGTSKRYTLRKLSRRQARPTLNRAAQTGVEWDGQIWKLGNACPTGAAGIVASGERIVVSGQ